MRAHPFGSSPSGGGAGPTYICRVQTSPPVLAAVVVVSDRSAAGEREDRSGPVAVEKLAAAGFTVGVAVVVPDGSQSVESALRAALGAGARFVVTSGGTGVGPRDQTPEGTLPVIDRHLPGIAELLRRCLLYTSPSPRDS